MDPRHLSERDAEAGLASPGIDPYADDGYAERRFGRREQATEFRWKTNLWLFLLTVLTTLLAGVIYNHGGALPDDMGFVGLLRALPSGWNLSVPLLAILLTHEFGHYFAARYHGVPASLPYFIPFPVINPVGTMGAVIAMPERIRSRNALLDIGAAGPLAGLVVAIPVLVIGLMGSKVGPMPEHGALEGQSILYIALKRIVLGPIPEGWDVNLNATAMAGWAGLLVTMLNLLPVSQLDGGHIAYALFGPKQNRFARLLHFALLVPVFVNFCRFVPQAILTHGDVEMALGNSVSWLPWFGILFVLKRFAGENHPPTDPGELSPVRKAVAVFSLVLFVLLFMPTVMTVH
ncbi:site-2 protease family protein [Polyangium aurulentum]|uniref:site-2 protease family protein n=1 Tax=Polyangium aurulentum TaxID=2567896 RepID=UPI0010ADD9C4|nr:site-2 protease family protein [Polyangium aurulentum]UQA62097.1 site-2 protease family protein [Polyangium aurulentum]